MFKNEYFRDYSVIILHSEHYYINMKHCIKTRENRKQSPPHGFEPLTIRLSDSLIEGIIKKGVLMMNSKEEGEHSNIVNC